MIIDVLNSDMKKIDILRKYTYVQYVEKAREIGEFTILAQLLDENLYLLDRTKQYYVLFEGRVFGKIESAKQSDDFEFEKTIQIVGRLSEYIFTKRVVDGTVKYKGNTSNYIKYLIEREFVNASDVKRRINFDVVFNNESLLEEQCSSISRENTGGYVWDEIETYLVQDKLAISVVPIVHEERVVSGIPTNISRWKVIIDCGIDRTQSNKYGNEPIIFSKSMSNITRTDYERDVTNYRGVAYVAGEGEGTDRKWFVKYRDNEEQKSGWNRDELWIDARDVQSEVETDEDGNETVITTPEEYEAMINQRVDEKFSECEIVENYSSTMARDKKRLRYRDNVFLGDWCTVKDEQLGIYVDAQIVEATITEQDSQRIEDVGVEYGRAKKDSTEVIKTLLEKVDSQQSNINYLLNKKTSTNNSGSGGDVVVVGATIQAGTAETLPYGSKPYVRNSGTNKDAIFNFGIPEGKQGENGKDGKDGTNGINGTNGKDGLNGQDGKPAGFGIVSASVDSNVGIPSVEVKTSGTNEALNIDFLFHNLKGKDGKDGVNSDGTGSSGGCNCDLESIRNQIDALQKAVFNWDVLSANGEIVDTDKGEHIAVT